MMRGFVVDGSGAAERSFAEAEGQFRAASFVWLHLDGRETEAQTWIGAQADIPEIARSALVAAETRPRADIMAHGALVNLRGLGSTPEDDPDPLVAVRLWAEAGRVVSVTKRSSQALEPVIARFLGGQIADPGDLVAAFADTISDSLDPDVAALGDSLDDVEAELESDGIYHLRRQVALIRNRAIGYRRFVAPQRLALERLGNAPVDWLDEEDRLHLREAADRAARMVEELESVRERSALIHDELTDLRAEQLDSRALLLSIAALIFLPVTFITGLLGMNVKGIPGAEAPWAFWGVTGLCVAIAIAVTAWFVRAHWISR